MTLLIANNKKSFLFFFKNRKRGKLLATINYGIMLIAINTSRGIMKIEDSTGIFTISELDEETNETYIGEFKVKLVLSPLDILSIDRDYRELVGTTNPFLATNDATNIAFALSQLKYRITSAPYFWEAKITNYRAGHVPKKILYSVLDKTLELHDMFKKNRKEELDKMQSRLVEQITRGEIKKTTEEDTELTEEKP